jgi:RecA/RadA recombinase
MRPSNFAEQATTVDRLPEYLTDHFGLVVVDTLTSLYRVKIAEYPRRAFELNRELNRQLALLAQISKMHKIAVLAVSQVSASFKEEQTSIEPVATRVLKFWADTIMDMKPTEKTKIVKLVLEKASKLQPTTYYLSITESGIHECSIH